MRTNFKKLAVGIVEWYPTNQLLVGYQILYNTEPLKGYYYAYRLEDAVDDGEGYSRWIMTLISTKLNSEKAARIACEKDYQKILDKRK